MTEPAYLKTLSNAIYASSMEEQELSTFYNIPVLTYHLEALPTEVSVSIPPGENGVEVAEVLRKVCKHHGIRKENIQYFTLVDGRSRPKKRFKPEDTITAPFPELCLKKWTFTAKEERHLVDDPSALHLLHLEAALDVKSGKIKPTSDQLQKLEEYMEPKFCLKNQYVLCCHNVDRYWSVVFNDVRVRKCDQNNNSLIPADAQISLYITQGGIEFHKGSTWGFVLWRYIRSWTAERKSGNIQFDITRHTGDTWCVKLETQQTQYLIAAISEILKSQQTEDSLFYTCMINTDREKDQTTWDNALYDPNPEGQSTGGQTGQGQDSMMGKDNCIDLTKLDWT